MSVRAAGRSRPRMILIGVAAITLALLTVVGLKLARGSQVLGEVKLHPYPAADFSMDLLNGGHFALGDQRGKVVVLNFWASWCVPCQEEAPLLESTWQRYRAEDVVFIGVDIKDTPDDARSCLRHYVSSYPNGFDAQKRIYIDYGVYGLPETFVVDPEGLYSPPRDWPGDAAAIDSMARFTYGAGRRSSTLGASRPRDSCATDASRVPVGAHRGQRGASA